MSTDEKKTLLATLVYAEEIALGNIPADLSTMTEKETDMYFDGYVAMLMVCNTLSNGYNSVSNN